MLRRVALTWTDGRIGGGDDALLCLDAHGLLVLPALVDLHGDAFERALQPRPGINLPMRLAVDDAAAQIAAAGIATAFLAVTCGWEPGLRSVATWQALTATLAALRTPLDLRLHLRFEADNLDAVPLVESALAAGGIGLLGFNDHTPSTLRKLDDPATAGAYAARGGVTADAFRALAERAAAGRAGIGPARARLASAARAASVPMLSHDDPDVATRDTFRALGAGICEFPMTEAVAVAARGAGDAVLMGAPNVVRGGSHLNWAAAAPLAERGLVTVLASDYHWPSLLAAPFVLAARGVLDLPAAWALVSANPAAAAGLHDRGELAFGRRADIVVVDPAGPVVVGLFVAGRPAYLSAAGAARLTNSSGSASQAKARRSSPHTAVAP